MLKRTTESELLTAIILEVFRLNGSLLLAGNTLTKPHNLTSARWQVLGAIELANQPLTVAQIARRMGLARQGVQRIVNDLVALKLLSTKPNIDHKRAVLVSLTGHGEKMMATIDQVQAEWSNRMSSGMGKTELNNTLETLKAIRNRIDE